MSLHAAIVVALLASTGCATVAPQSYPVVDEAIRLQNEVLRDSRFTAILLDMQEQGAITWDEPLTPSAAIEAATESSLAHWLAKRYAMDGGYTRQEVRLWRKWYPFSSTTAVTGQGAPTTRLNIWRLDRTAISVANTPVHERVHSFGQGHAHGQTKPPNQCDAAYVAGDLAQVLLAKGEKAIVFAETPICPGLCAAVRRRGLQAPSACGEG
jgi:hypothetical protein